MNELNLAGLLDEVVDWRYKSFPPTDGRVRIGTVGEQGWNALGGDLLFPVMVLRESALGHNIDLMARYCRERAVSLAPHGKTPMAPQIVQRQLEAGAWGITAATVSEARVFRAFGVRRILLASELVEPAGVAWVAAELAQDPNLDFFCLADSVEGVGMMAETLERLEPSRRLRVLVELGAPGGRAGCRTVQEARAVAAAVYESACLELAGVEGYEGAIAGQTVEERVIAVDRFLQEMRALTIQLAREGLFDGLEEIVVSAGGSVFFDRVVEQLTPPWDLSLPVRVVLRAGSYVTHDSDSYELLSPLAQRGGGSDRLRPALELWGMVISTPEPGLAIANFGKRDVSHDLALPIPFERRRSGQSVGMASEVVVTALNDQHAFLRFDPSFDLAVGDLIGCGISHPCTACDKWQLIPLVDDAYDVVGAIHTFF